MPDLDARARALCTGLGGCAFLLTLEEAGLPLETAARPEVAIDAAGKALSTTPPWLAESYVRHVEILRAAGPRLCGFARSLLSLPAADWLFAPLNRSAQLWFSPDGDPPDPAGFLPPNPAYAVWERYGQKPRNYRGRRHPATFFTSTAVGESTSVLASRVQEAIEWPIEPPVQHFRLTVSPSARVFEVDGPDAWHRLCVAYPAPPYQAPPPPPKGYVGWAPYPGAAPPLGLDDRLVPDWNAVAHDWDGVHLSLGGLLASEQVRVDSPAGWTELWGWGAEQTIWLRWSFTALERLPPLTTPPAPVLGFGWPRWTR